MTYNLTHLRLHVHLFLFLPTWQRQICKITMQDSCENCKMETDKRNDTTIFTVCNFAQKQENYENLSLSAKQKGHPGPN